MGDPRKHNGSTLGYPLDHHGSYMEAPCFYGNTMLGITTGPQWGRHGSTMEAPWKHHGSIMEEPWDHHRRTMGLSSKHHGSTTITTEAPWKPMEAIMEAIRCHSPKASTAASMGFHELPPNSSEAVLYFRRLPRSFHEFP